MSSSILNLLSAAAPGGGFQSIMQSGIVPIVLMGVIFWFLIIRPQMRRQKEHRTKIDAIKKGDQVLTGGGLVGKVTRVDEHYADIEIANGVKVKAVKSTIADVIDPTSASPAND